MGRHQWIYWILGVICALREWFHDLWMSHRSKRDAQSGEPWSLPLDDGSEQHVHLQ